ncbi:ATP-dependent RNA helicase [Legionella birminghamensis]|uniref:ATP-dependent RNA helicase n=1 Tax=Legionella birminghamensis TaxID=28083 RepID=A0A378IBG3_9GAMM|nr:ATP-dependent RNA helicase DbpA [Legionella birminghamensis]KTC75989.1 ATP-dependent RNA helicase [Legionella birminghamensis]STX32115.1 ATP-dependent RNA helicase [Legionella birminghamensis]
MDTSSEKAFPDYSGELSFSSLALRKELLNNLLSLNYHQMTAIQAQSLPLLLNRTDVIAQAQTGSGKTVAFGLALLHHLKTDRPQMQSLVLCPTRELAEQVCQVLRRLARLLPNIKILNLSGGTPIRAQYDSLRHGAHIIIGTPGRVQKHLEQKSLSLSHIDTVILDEADRMLDMGFVDSLRQILGFCPSRRQTLLFSATFTPEIKQLAKEFMRHPQEVKAEEPACAQEIEQRFFEVENQSDKYPILKKILMHYQPASTLIFCNTKEKTQELASLLKQDGFSAGVLNGDLEQVERDQAIIQFANHSRCILVATDVAARGLDIKELPAVINFDLAFEPEVHVHRIGRTGRAGSKGLALSITTPKDAERLCAIEELINEPLVWGTVNELSAIPSSSLSPSMITLGLMAGRKDKIRPGDILGALTKDAGLKAEAIGKIDILSAHSYVAIERSQIGKAYAQFQNGKIKGKKVGVKRLS